MTATLSLDSNMLNAYKEGKDLYAIIAQSAFNNDYQDNLEFFVAGTELELDGKKVIAGNKTHLNKAGKERRSVGKTLLLASTYGMSGRTAGIRMQKSAEEGQQLLDNFFNGFPKVKKAIDDSKDFLRKTGYVEDFIGRRRRLPDVNLHPYQAVVKEKVSGIDPNFNPIFGCTYRKVADDPANIWQMILDGYVLLANARRLAKMKKSGDEASFVYSQELSKSIFEDYKKVASKPKELLDTYPKYTNKKGQIVSEKSTYRQKILSDMQAVYLAITQYKYKTAYDSDYYDLSDNKEFIKACDIYKGYHNLAVAVSIPDTRISLLAWTGRIAQAERQCFNARIQGSAATLTKIAMVDIANDQEMKDCQAQLIIPVHDELLVECPEYYADRVEKRLPEIMIGAAAKHITEVGMKCDPYNVTRWYADEYAVLIQEEFKKLEAGDPKKGIAPLSRDAALATVIKAHSEVPEAAIIKTIETGCDLDF